MRNVPFIIPKPWACAAAALLLTTGIDSQEEAGGQPYSSLHELGPAGPSVRLPLSAGALSPLVESDQAPLQLGLNNSGSWSMLADGGRVWRLRLSCPESTSMALEFRHFSLPPGAVLFVYDDHKAELHGGFDARNNDHNASFSIHPIQASALTLEYYEPPGVQQSGILMLDTVHCMQAFEFKAQEPTTRGKPARCQVDVACEAGLAWQTLVRSIVKIEGAQHCTGVLINNSSGDGTPYILTARHCGNLSWCNFWFGWRRQVCGQDNAPELPGFKSIAGSTLIAESPLHDLQLVRLNQTPGADFNVHYAGWDHSTRIPESVATLHHPFGDVMKISVERQKPLVKKLDWKIRRWDIGITESGSSGAPLFNEEQRVIGQLRGGPATCKKPQGDLFGRLAPEWEFLAPYLDPRGSGSMTLDGIDLDPSLLELGIIGFGEPDLRATESPATLHGIGFRGRLRVSIDGKRLPGAQVKWRTNSRLDLHWKGLAPGEHVLSIENGEQTLEHTFSTQADQSQESTDR